MNNGLQFFNVIIPLVIFLVLLALGQVFNREQQAGQPRAPSGSMLGPRPGAGASSWSNAPQARRIVVEREGRLVELRASRRDDGILILEQGTAEKLPANIPSAILETPSDRKQRRRNRSGNAAKRPQAQQTNPATPRLGATKLADVSNPNLSETQQEPATGATLADSPSPSAQAIADMLRNPRQVREAIILNTILQPPPGRQRLARDRRA